MADDSGKTCAAAEEAAAPPSTFNFADLDFLDMLTPPRPTQGQPQVVRCTTPYQTPVLQAAFLPTAKQPRRAPPAPAHRQKTAAQQLSQRIAETDKLVQQLRQLEKDRAQLAQQLKDFQQSATEIQRLYEAEKRQRRQLDVEVQQLRSESARLDTERAHRTLQFDQLQAQWDATKGPIEYGALVVRYLKFAAKREEAKLLHWTDQALVEDLNKYCQQHQLSVPSKASPKKRKRIYKSEKAVQCELQQELMLPPPPPPPPPPMKETRTQASQCEVVAMRTQGTQHISTTTTRSTSTSCFIKRHNVATSFPERAPLPPLNDMLQELLAWDRIAPVSPIIDLPKSPVAVAAIVTTTTPPRAPALPQLKSQGTCTYLCNIQRQIDFLPPANLIKRSNSRPPSRLAFDANVKRERGTTTPPLTTNAAATTTTTSLNGSGAVQTPAAPIAAASNLLQISAASPLTPCAFEELWQVFGHMLLGLLQHRSSSGGTNASPAAAAASDALSQQEFHNWMRSFYDNMQQQQQHMAAMPADQSSSSPLVDSDSVLHRPQARRDFSASTLATSDDHEIEQTPSSSPRRSEPDGFLSPQHQSIGTSPIRFAHPEEVPLEEHENVVNNHNTETNVPLELIPRIRLPSQTEYASVTEPNSNIDQRPGADASETVSDTILNFVRGDDSKEKRQSIKNLVKRSKKHRKSAKSKNKKPQEFECVAGSYVPNVEVTESETAVEFLSNLSLFKAESTADLRLLASTDEAKYMEILCTSRLLESEDLENILNIQNCGSKREEHEVGIARTVSDVSTLEERRNELREIEYSLFGSDTDLEGVEDEDVSMKMEAAGPFSLPTTGAAVEEIVEIELGNQVKLDVIEYEDQTKSEVRQHKIEAQIREYENCEKYKLPNHVKTHTKEEEALQTHIHVNHEPTELKDNTFKVPQDNKTFVNESFLVLSERNPEITTVEVENYVEIKEADNLQNIASSQPQENALEEIPYHMDLIIDEELELSAESENSIIEISSEIESRNDYDDEIENTEIRTKAVVNESSFQLNIKEDVSILPPSTPNNHTSLLENSIKVHSTMKNSEYLQKDNSPESELSVITLSSETSGGSNNVLADAAQKVERSSTDLSETSDETASLSALLNTSSLNELLSDPTTTLVIDEMLNDAVAIGPTTNSADIRTFENNLFNVTDAIKELEDMSSSSQITPKKRGRKRKIDSASNTTPVVVCKRSERLRVKQQVVHPLVNEFLSPVVLGKYTKRHSSSKTTDLENSTPKIQSPKSKKPHIEKTDNEDLSLQINMGFFKERHNGDEASPMIVSETPNTKNCDSLLEQPEVKRMETNEPSSFVRCQSRQKARLTTSNDKRVREHYSSYVQQHRTYYSASSAQTKAIVTPISNTDTKLSLRTSAPVVPKDNVTQVSNVVASKKQTHESLCTLTVVPHDAASFSQLDFLAFDESPASPTMPTSEEESNSHAAFPKEIPLELDESHQPCVKPNSLLKRLVDVYSADQYKTINSPYSIKELEQRNQIATQLESCIRKYLKNEMTPQTIVNEAAQLVRSLLQMTGGGGNYDLIGEAIVREMREVARPEQELKCPLTELPTNSLSTSHQRIAYVMRHLQHERATFASDLIVTVENVLFNYQNAEQLNLNPALNLTNLYLLAVGQLSLAPLNPARLFIGKCLYFHRVKSLPMIYEVLCCFPTVLPNRDDRSYDRSNALITVIQHTLMCNKYDMERSDLRPKELLSKLRFEYHFEPFKPERSEVLTNLIEKLKAGRLKHLKYAFGLLCKRMHPAQVESVVLQEHLVPLANEYYTCVQQSQAHDLSTAGLLDCISMVVKPFPIETNAGVYLDLFARFLNVVDRPVIQEAAVQAVLRLQRFGAMNCYNALLHFMPAYELQPKTKAMLKTFIHRKPLGFWRSCGEHARMGVEH